MARLRLTKAAKTSLKEIGTYTGTHWGKLQPKKYLSILDASFNDIAAFPRKGTKREDIHACLFSWPAGKHVIFYLIDPNGIIIVDIVHQQMDPLLHVRVEH